MTEDYTLLDLKMIIKEAIKESFEEIDEFKRKIAFEEAKARLLAGNDLINELTKSMNPKIALGTHDFPINYECTFDAEKTKIYLEKEY